MLEDFKRFTRDRLEIITILAIILFKIWKLVPINSAPLGSADFASHTFKIQYIIEHGVTQWNFGWYGGFPFLNFHGPLTYLSSAAIGIFTGATTAFNILHGFSWILLTLAIYLFLKEYNLNKIQTSLSLIVFSFMPVVFHYIKIGNLPLVFSFLVSVLFWRSFKRYSEGKEGPVLSIVFFTFSLLSHPMVWVFLTVSILVWSFSKYPFSSSFKRLFLVGLVTALLSSFWLIPFSQSIYLGSGRTAEMSSQPVAKTSNVIFSKITRTGMPIEIFAIMAGLLAFGMLYSLRNNRRLLKEFLPLLFVQGILFLFINYKRILLFSLIPISILISCKHKKVNWYFLAVLIIFPLAFSTLLLGHTQVPDFPETGNRTIVYPPSTPVCNDCVRYESFLVHSSGSEIINGEFPQVNNKGPLEGKRELYLKKINQPLNLSEGEFNSLTRSGMVNYVVVDSNSTDYIRYFEKNSRFKNIDGVEGKYNIFKAHPKFTFLELNNKPINSSPKKSADKITSKFPCQTGVLEVKETYDSGWHLSINGNKKIIEPTDNGFIQTNVTEESGECLLEMRYNRIPNYSIVLLALGIIILFLSHKRNLFMEN